MKINHVTFHLQCSIFNVNTTLTQRFDLLRVPLVGRFLRWRHARTTLQTVLLMLAALIMLDGFMGIQLAPRNLAGVLPWVQWRGLIVLALLIGSNFFCMACPFMLPRRLAKKLFSANRAWPRRLRNKWLALALLVLFFWTYEVFDLWASPLLTAWIILAYFVAAFVIDAFFRGAAFCKYVCPIGQFNFVNSLVSPLEVSVRDTSICASCPTKDCIKGRTITPAQPAARPATLLGITSIGVGQIGVGRPAQFQSGCELWLFQPQKVGNTDCTFCLDCVQACPYENVGILARSRTHELANDARRSGVGRWSERTDLAALVVVLVFAAFTNAFGMVGPFYAVQDQLLATFGAWSVPVFFALSLAVLPLVLVGATAWASRTLSRSWSSIVQTATTWSYGLVPLGFGMWLAHYLFHFLTGALTFVPVLQEFVARWVGPILGAARWDLAAVVPQSWLLPIEILALDGGLLGSLLVLWRVARREHGVQMPARRAFAPWAVLVVLLFAAGVWLLLQPMDMRGTVAG